MSTLLLIGVGPTPSPERMRVHAPGLRLEMFRRVLEGAGHRVFLGEFTFGSTGHPGPSLHSVKPPEQRGDRRILPADLEEAPSFIGEWIEEINPHGVIALTDVGALATVRSGWTGPLWVDYFGHPMAERQQQAFAHVSNESLADQWLFILPVLLRADWFSANSNAQRLALTGELGAAGRLNMETCGHDLVAIIPPSLPFEEPLVKEGTPVLAEQGIPPDARVILSTGGFNTWFDEETLFKALEIAMEEDAKIHFVASGGSIEGHVNVVYKRFVERIRSSPYASRYHMIGWVKHKTFVNLLLEADVGINSDRWSLEGELGCRNRLYGWLWGGMRVVTTVTSESTAKLSREKMVTSVPENDPESMAEALVEAARKGRLDQDEAAERREKLRAEWSAESQCEPLLRWAEFPTCAPDRPDGGEVNNPLAVLQTIFLETAQDAQALDQDREQVARAAESLLGSRIVRFYGKLHPELVGMLEELRKK